MACDKAKRHSRKAIVVPLMQALKKMTPTQRTIILAHLDDKTHATLCDVVSRVVKSKSIPKKRSKSLKKRLAPYKADFRFVTSAKNSAKAKKKRLVQMGGNPLALILGTALPLLLNLFRK